MLACQSGLSIKHYSNGVALALTQLSSYAKLEIASVWKVDGLRSNDAASTGKVAMTERFGAYARKQRVAHRISLKQVADRLGLSTVYISDIERGNRNPLGSDKLLEWADEIQADGNEFLALAELERGGVELPLSLELGQTRNALALALARSWKDLTSDEEDALKEAMANRLKKDGPGNGL